MHYVWLAVVLIVASLRFTFPQGCSEGDVRLAEGNTTLEGRVEICMNSSWGTVCDRGWDTVDAKVACQQLGFSAAGGIAINSAFYDEGTGPVVLSNLACAGTEARLVDCPSGVIGLCNHSEDAGAQCYARTNCSDGEVKLSGGSNSLEGRVEVCYDGAWGTVCSNDWGRGEVSVVCRELGYSSSGGTARLNAAFGEGVGPIVLDNLMCRGLEYRLFDCASNGLGISNCLHDADAGVSCVAGCSEGEVRLVGGTNHTEGRVEICLNDEWGTVCDQMWDATDAGIVCRQLGLASTGAIAFSQASFGEGTGRIWLTNVRCLRSERALINCTASSNGVNSCMHSQDAGVRCPPVGCTEGDVRLLEGQTNQEGRLEICWKNEWGTVCYLINDEAAGVVCRQLGFSAAGVFISRPSRYGLGIGPVALDYANCHGDELSLLNCSIGKYQFNRCGHDEDVGLRCHIKSGCSDGDIRLIGSTSWGRIEMCYSGYWSSVCNRGFNETAASVVCRELNFTSIGATVLYSPDIPFGYGDMYYDNFMCTGQESRLIDCQHSFHKTSCSGSSTPGVRCQPACTEGDVRLIGGVNAREGRVEICHNHDFGTVCDQMWSATDASVVCRQVGQAAIGATAVGGASFGQGSHRIWLVDVQCVGSERRLEHCPAVRNGVNSCTHAQDAGVRCPSSGCSENDVRLVGGRSDLEGYVQICKNNIWGTVCGRWSTPNGIVVCRQLGFSDLSADVQSVHFGPGDGPIYLTNVQCTFREARLADCRASTDSSDLSRCTHNDDVSIHCWARGAPCSSPSLRLVGGTNSSEGRVEVCYAQQWGTICGSTSFNAVVAGVICRQLGFSRHNAQVAFFGPGGGAVVYGYVVCHGYEASLFDCFLALFPLCLHNGDVGVRCSTHVLCNDGTIRLVNGTDKYEGRVEICYNEEWGSICGGFWTVQDSIVACRQLEFPTSGAISYVDARFGEGDGAIYLSSVECVGNESRLLDCNNSGLALLESCEGHLEAVVEIRCKEACSDGSVRLTGTSERHQGRLELCLNDTWRRVCVDSFNNSDAGVACKQLGFAQHGATVLPNTVFEASRPTLHFNGFHCEGYEDTLWRCSYDLLDEDCLHSQDISIVCQMCNDGEVQLRGGSSFLTGRVELCHDGQWGTVCDEMWDAQDANVLCAQLGFSRRNAVAMHGASFGEGEGLIYLGGVQCSGLEASILDCVANMTLSLSCDHSHDAGVECSSTVFCTEGDVRLEGGEVPAEGRVEVCHLEWWQTICNMDWGVEESAVVCQQLGYSRYNTTQTPGAAFGVANDFIYGSSVMCASGETRLIDCHYNSSTSKCSHSNDVGVICSSHKYCLDGDVRLVGGDDEMEGRVELCYEEEFGTVCGDGFDMQAAVVVCRQLGYSSLIVAGAEGMYGDGSGEVWLDNYTCNGSEPSLLSCERRGQVGVTACTHSQDAGVRCHTKSTHPSSLLLEAIGNSINISWTPPREHSSLLISYKVTCSTDQQEHYMMETLDNETLMATFLDLRYFNQYNCCVEVVYADPSENASSCNNVSTREGVPGQPTNLTVVPQDDCSVVELSWSPPPREQQNGIILGYHGTLRNSSGEQFYFDSDMESFITLPKSLICCSNYTYQVSARTSAGIGALSRAIPFTTNGLYDDLYTVSIATGANSIYVSWNDSNSNIQQELHAIQVLVTPVCSTGIMEGRTQRFDVTPNEGNFINATELDVFVPYHVLVSAWICEETFELYNDTVIIQIVNPVIPTIITDLVRSSPTAVSFNISQAPNPITNYVFEVLYYAIDNPETSINEGDDVLTFRTNHTTIDINDLHPCILYSLEVTAIDCTHRTDSSPHLIGFFEPLEFTFAISFLDQTSCERWIADNLLRKISDVEESIFGALRKCSQMTTIPCVANSQFTCGIDPSVTNFETTLVSADSYSSRQQLQCLSKWVASITELGIAGMTAMVMSTKVTPGTTTVSISGSTSPSIPIYVWPLVAIAAVVILITVILVVVLIMRRHRKQSSWRLMENEDENSTSVSNPLYTTASTFEEENDMDETSYMI